ncbi:MAG: DNA repair protein RadA [Bdellovibrionales bacterium]|nr:DNA repair protein RadA [Bdellovibrionales bacterium]
MAKAKSVFICQQCGAQRARWEGKCSDCGAWNSFVEETTAPATKSNARGWSVGNERNGTTLLKSNSQVSQISIDRHKSEHPELNRVLGGGIMPGSLVLIGGDPGIGKSTLLMQMAGSLGRQEKAVIYISAEESVEQTILRAQRIGVSSENVLVGSENDIEQILSIAEKEKPDVMIVDSIQTVFLPDITSAPGSVTQVRECAARLMSFAKTKGTAIFLVGHVTKEGELAGPKVLEHMVDTVLSFEGDSNHHFRILRAVKNRFGAAHELGVFEMAAGGLRDVINPSELFLRDREQGSIGSAVAASLEGSRPVLGEIQALTVPSYTSMPRRTSLGIELNRLHLLIAVLDKYLGTSLGKKDVFLNVAGGLKIKETASDLAVCAAILSSLSDFPIPMDAVFIGEVGLTGDIRGVPQVEVRINEAQKLGFEKFYVADSNKKHLKEIDKKLSSKIVWMKSVEDLTRVTQPKKMKPKSPVQFQ